MNLRDGISPLVCFCFVALTFASLASNPAWASANYFITDLGTLGGDFSSATDLNETGQVVGVARTADGSDRAFLWQDGVMTDLGTLGGTNSHASAINESGHIVGWAELPDGRIRACLFGAESNVDVGTGTNNSFASDINDKGRVVGWTDTRDPNNRDPRAVVFSPTVRDLGYWDGGTIRGRALAINNWDRVAGWTGTYSLWSMGSTATVWYGITGINPYLRIGGTEARDVNESFEYVGKGDFPYRPERAMYWPGTNGVSLGSLALGSSVAEGINNSGQIVGSAQAYRFGLITNYVRIFVLPGFGGDTNPPPPEPQIYWGYTQTKHAFIWQDGLMSDLNDLIPRRARRDWELVEATAINDAGQIVGRGRLNGKERAFLLTPRRHQNKIPFVEIVSPLEGEWVAASNLTLQARAYDRDGRVRKVEFLAKRVSKNNSPGVYPISIRLGPDAEDPRGHLGTVTKRPFQLEATNLEAGNYIVMAKATDNRGATACSPEVLIRVQAPPTLTMIMAQPLRVYLPENPVDASQATNLLTLHLSGFHEELIYDIEESFDLVHWTKIGEINPAPQSPFYSPVVIGNPTIWFGGPSLTIGVPTNSHGFYRAVAR